jgi:hypothetical protein
MYPRRANVDRRADVTSSERAGWASFSSDPQNYPAEELR